MLHFQFEQTCEINGTSWDGEVMHHDTLPVYHLSLQISSNSSPILNEIWVKIQLAPYS